MGWSQCRSHGPEWPPPGRPGPETASAWERERFFVRSALQPTAIKPPAKTSAAQRAWISSPIRLAEAGPAIRTATAIERNLHVFVTFGPPLRRRSRRVLSPTGSDVRGSVGPGQARNPSPGCTHPGGGSHSTPRRHASVVGSSHTEVWRTCSSVVDFYCVFPSAPRCSLSSWRRRPRGEPSSSSATAGGRGSWPASRCSSPTWKSG